MTIKIGLIGCGGMAGLHAAAYLQLRDKTRITAVSDIRESNAQQMAMQVGGARVFGDFRELIAEGDVDAVDICLPHHLHKDAIVAAATMGKHILCEKPMCVTAAEADEIRAAVQASGVTLMCAHNQLFDPAVQRAKALLNEDIVGRVYEIRTADMYYMPQDMSLDWRSTTETMGGGELIDTGYHPTYILLFLAGSAPREVMAIMNRWRIQTMSGEDSAHVLVRFQDGILGNIVTSWAYERPAGAWQFHVIGERGQIYGDGNRLYHKLPDAEPTVLLLPEIDTIHAEIEHFLACLRDGSEPIQTLRNGSEVLSVILGAYRSHAEQRMVSLSTIPT